MNWTDRRRCPVRAGLCGAAGGGSATVTVLGDRICPVAHGEGRIRPPTRGIPATIRTRLVPMVDNGLGLIFSKELDKAVTDMGVRIRRTPVRAPLANSACERLVGTMRRECLDFLIPLGERQLRRTLQLWIDHYNRGRPHMRPWPWHTGAVAGAATAKRTSPPSTGRSCCSQQTGSRWLAPRILAGKGGSMMPRWDYCGPQVTETSARMLRAGLLIQIQIRTLGVISTLRRARVSQGVTGRNRGGCNRESSRLGSLP